MDHIQDLHARPTENETWPEPQVGGSTEATETSPSLPDLPLPVVEATEVPTSVCQFRRLLLTRPQFQNHMDRQRVQAHRE